jgi:hypothetical protein
MVKIFFLSNLVSMSNMLVEINLRFVFSFCNLCLLYRSFIDLLQFCVTSFSVMRYLRQSCVTFFSPVLPSSVSCVTVVNPALPSSVLRYLLQSCVTFFSPALPSSVLRCLGQSCVYLCPMFYLRSSFITFISLVFTFCHSFCVLTYC